MREDNHSYLLKTIQDYGKGLLSFIRGRVKSEADAQDILQDIWYSLSLIVNTSPVEQTSAWLYKVARNKITDKYRKRSESSLDDLFEDDEDQEYSSILFSDSTTPETEYLKNLFWKQLFVALDELPPEQKEVFVWQELEGIPFQTISERTGVNVQTLVSRKRYAVLHLRERLRQLYEELND
ncbi:MAG: sigma-70 family RNA polymerase sigma factor [Pedobacter sp.]|nr:MAG: sigma-70 family RNA polymerase sigma factor [Pedobacter sp.]